MQMRLAWFAVVGGFARGGNSFGSKGLQRFRACPGACSQLSRDASDAMTKAWLDRQAVEQQRSQPVSMQIDSAAVSFGRTALLSVFWAVVWAVIGPRLEAQEGAQSIFDGETLAGWECLDSDRQWWTVEEGLIRGGSLERRVPHNTFLATKASYQNFDLRLSIRLEGSGGLVNSGIQIRSVRVEGSAEMSGYQVDAGEGWWGKLYDESRRNRVIAEPQDENALLAAIDSEAWNHYRILAEGPRLRTWINGVPALDYTETEGDTPLDGHIGLQVHSGGFVRVEAKDLSIERLADTPGAMTWRRYQKSQSVKEQGKAPVQSAAEELAGFHVLEGFEVELVTADPMIDKVVDIAFDDGGRLWAITAVEYPIDGNESEGVADLYARGGRDQVLVIDEPWKPGPHRPRVFADDLFIPMALSPRSDGVLIGMGPEIFRLHDDDGDGRADRREVLLTGFGIQDSHLLPHRFVRAPGGWTYLAQGAFNSSRVRTLDGSVTAFDKCKLGRFKADGSRFEVVGIGLNNIWGMVLDRSGDKWIQEANDLGYPLVPFEHGRSYPGIGMDRFHPHSPWHPPYADFSMGGTGLSGLALSEDEGGFPAPWNETFFLANPILSSVQSVRATRTPEAPSAVELERVRDLLTSEDKNFRPVAIHFGPDACLYIVDWYNPIISHNEVPRDHPDRDRTSSRIWRVRHKTQERRAPIDVSAAPDEELLRLLQSGNTWTARAAWHQIAERQATQLSAGLTELLLNEGAKTRDRVLAAWCLQDLGRVDAGMLKELGQSGDYELRRECARLASMEALDWLGSSLAQALSWSPEEADPRVRVTAIESLSACRDFDAQVARLLLDFVRPLPAGPTVRSNQLGGEVLTGVAADIAFERSLVRAALESQPTAVFDLLDGGAAPQGELARFALMSVGGVEGARRLATLLHDSDQVPSREELPFLAEHGDEQSVRLAVSSWIAKPETRADGLRILADSKLRWEDGPLAPVVVSSLRALLEQDPSPDSRGLLLRVARERRLSSLEGDVRGLLESGGDAVACLRALGELGCQDVELYARWARGSLPGSEARRVTTRALAAVESDLAFELLGELWFDLETASRREVLEVLLERASSARRLLAALDAGELDSSLVQAKLLDRMRQHLGEDPALVRLRDQFLASQERVLRLDGGGDDFVNSDLRIDGPFTIEAWVRLDEGIDNRDGLLLAPGVFDLNFHDARLRLWLGPQGDVIIAKRRLAPEIWTHFALTRAVDGRLSLYVNGELDNTAQPEADAVFESMDLLRTGPAGGTAGEVSELRFWSLERSAVEIGANYRLRLGADDELKGLEVLLPARPMELSGSARLEGVLDGPPLLSMEEIAAEEARFDRYRALARASGDAARGREVFVENCAACHRVAGEGVSIGPVLDGVAAKGTEGLLRSILTPNAGVESGYRTLIVRTKSGEFLEGFLAEETEDSILLRRKDRDDLRLDRADLESARFDTLSLMPEGLLEALSDDQVRDLFAHLLDLK